MPPNLLDILVNVGIATGIFFLAWAFILFLKRRIFKRKPAPISESKIRKPPKFTDIKFPKKTELIPRESLLKRFFKWCVKIILAPFVLLKKLIVACLRGIKSLIVGIVTGIKNLILFIIRGIKNVILAILLAIKNFFIFIASGLKSFVKALLPKSLAGWIVLLLVLIFLWQVFSSVDFPAVDKDKWQAVFLTNDQVYFGHLKDINSEYVALKEAYYLRPSQEEEGKIDLVKLGDELHNPEQHIYIPKNQILFWEDLKNDSQVVQLIDRLRNQ